MRGNSITHILISLIFFALAVLASPEAQAEPTYEAGAKLFKQNCSSCHKMQGKLVGPALEGAAAKYAGQEEWLKKWIRNAPALIKSGDEQAVALWNQYNQQQMTAFPQFSDENLESILAYLRDWKPAEPVATQVVGEGDAAAAGGSLNDPNIYYALFGLVGVLVLIALLLVVITATLVSSVRAKEQKEALTMEMIVERSKAILGNKFFIATFTTVVLLGGLGVTVREARTVGLNQGYMPEQPIKFSHKIHAGTYEIDCKYCHTGVTKSKSAWIPSFNVCMNCHAYIQEGELYGKEEISKIYDAVGYNVEEAAYTNTPNPDKYAWVRIHNVPDHAYFNHAQHVVVGNLECENCHGNVKEMEVVYQYSDLGMGWCINCHRNEKVKVLGEETEYTVADMGGLNCARCHY